MTLNCRSSRSSKFEVNYFKNGDRYDGWVNKSRIASRPLAINWHHDFWPWMTLNCPSSRSSKLEVKYFKNGDRYDIAVNRRRIGSHPWLLIGTMTFDLRWPWTVLVQGHQNCTSNVYKMMTDTDSIGQTPSSLERYLVSLHGAVGFYSTDWLTVSLQHIHRASCCLPGDSDNTANFAPPLQKTAWGVGWFL